MRFARWVFALAGISGVLMIAPMYFLESHVGHDFPPPINHPEFYYGFAGVTLAWQFMFLVIATDPLRYRLAMFPALFEKASFAIAAPILYFLDRVPVTIAYASLMDATWFVLFAIACWRTRALK